VKICNLNVNHEIEIYAFTAYGLHAILQHKFSVRKQYEKKMSLMYYYEKMYLLHKLETVLTHSGI